MKAQDLMQTSVCNNPALKSALILLLLLIPMLSISAQAIVVNTVDDELDGDVSSITNLLASPGGSGISLREAISAANNTAGADEIQFDASLNGTPIVLDIGASVENANVEGDLDATDAAGLTITGNGPDNTIIDGNQTGRVLHNQGGDFTLTGVTLQNGAASSVNIDGGDGGGLYSQSSVAATILVDNCIFKINSAADEGGALRVATTSLLINVTIQNTLFDQNTSIDRGGAIQIGALEAINKLIGCTFTNNTASEDDGGALDISGSGSKTEIDQCIFTGNRTLSTIEGDGGAFHNSSSERNDVGAETTITNSFFDNNAAAGEGGGLGFGSGSGQFVDIINTTISNNFAAKSGGGLCDCSTRLTLSILNSTISGNRTNQTGGGIFFNESGQQKIINFTTITNNTADADNTGDGDGGGIGAILTDDGGISSPQSLELSVRNTILQGNTDNTDSSKDDCSTFEGPLSTITITSEGGNVFGQNTGCEPGPDDTTDPANLGPLEDNGGLTLTHALLEGSAAIDFVDCEETSTDQRNSPRPNGSEFCDSGAFEAEITAAEEIPVFEKWALPIFCLVILGFGIMLFYKQ